jgi:hypothetical protein
LPQKYALITQLFQGIDDETVNEELESIFSDNQEVDSPVEHIVDPNDIMQTSKSLKMVRGAENEPGI